MDKIKCQNCGHQIEIDKALEMQIESRIFGELTEKHKSEIENLRKETESKAEEKMNQQLLSEIEKIKNKTELENERVKIKLQYEAEKKAQKQDLLIEQLQDDAKSARQSNKELRDELKKLNQALLEEIKSKENAELEAAKKVKGEVDRVREEVQKKADELHRLKEQELQKQLSDTKTALDEAQRKAEQGSEQIQGEVLELELETMLRAEFPADLIEEVKKGQRGADVQQRVRNLKMEECGLILWESKNAKWSNAWINKLKDDVRECRADVGIIVSRHIPEAYDDMMSVESNIWVVKPRLIPAIATALRNAIIQVYTANRNSENKDEKMEILYQFLTGVEFRNRIEAIVDNYNALLKEIEKEKRAAQLRWGKQEKALRLVIDNTFGLYGDLQGITGSELKIPLLDQEEE